MPFGGICPGSNPGRPAKFQWSVNSSPKPTSLEAIEDGSRKINGDGGRQTTGWRAVGGQRGRAVCRGGCSRKSEGGQTGSRSQAQPQPERGQALQALQRHGEPAVD